MSASSTFRPLARASLRHVSRPSLAVRCAPSLSRSFSRTPANNQDRPPGKGNNILSSMYGKPADSRPNAPPFASSPTSTSPFSADPEPAQGQNKGQGINTMMDILGSSLGGNSKRPGASDLDALATDAPDALEPYHFHIYSHKHNSHVTVTKPDRGVIITLSTGNIGFRGSRRGKYDAAYQLTAYVLERLKYTGWEPKINRIELVLRGFGPGREAGVKVLMSPEGAKWRTKIVRVADSTRIKFGGTRSKSPRRL